MSKELTMWFSKNGIEHKIANMANPTENGVVERRARLVQVMIHFMLTDAGLPITYWAEAIKAACYILNRIGTQVIDNIPYRVLHSRDSSLNHLRIFGIQ